MRFGSFFLLISLTSSALSALPAVAGLSDALVAVRAGDWATANAAVAEDGRIAQDIVTWHRLRAGAGQFDDYVDFVVRNGDWPGLVQLRRAGEWTIQPDTQYEDVLAFFGNRHAMTAHGALYLANALDKAGRFREAREEIVLAWRMLPFSRSEQAIFQKSFADLLAPHNFARLDRLLWLGQSDQAERLFPYLTKGERALARARIGLRKAAKGVDALIVAVPKDLARDPGLAFERFLWRMQKGRSKSAEQLILAQSESAAGLGNPDYWSSARRALARDALHEGRAETAYAIAAGHHLTGGNDFADLEWMAGYIALKGLNKPEVALRHFQKFRAGIDSPVSLGRAAYWEAQAYKAMERPDDALVALEFGAEFQTGFYGLLAAEEADVPMTEEVWDTEPRGFAGARFWRRSVLSAGLMLARAGEPALAAQFLVQLFEQLPPEEQEKLGDVVLVLRQPYLAVSLGKFAASLGGMLPRPYFPLAAVPESEVPPELVLSIIRRESEFNTAAASGAGARGLMQLMPGTAEEVADWLDQPLESGALHDDPALNTLLGTEYLRSLRRDFGNNVLLVAAAYNAGPGRVRRWLSTYGDPRDPKVDALDWIESIPLRETRNYVMRVAESVVIYRARLAGGAQVIRLREEMEE